MLFNLIADGVDAVFVIGGMGSDGCLVLTFVFQNGLLNISISVLFYQLTRCAVFELKSLECLPPHLCLLNFILCLRLFLTIASCESCSLEAIELFFFASI